MSFEKFRIEMGRIKGAVEMLKVEISQEKLDRISCKSVLVELKTSI